MMRWVVGNWFVGALSVLLLALAGCAQPPSTSSEHDVGATLFLANLQAIVRPPITHRFTLRLPAAETEAVQQKHMAECIRLGCTILSTSLDRSNEGRISARASVRIKPESYDAFATLLGTPPAQI